MAMSMANMVSKSQTSLMEFQVAGPDELSKKALELALSQAVTAMAHTSHTTRIVSGSRPVADSVSASEVNRWHLWHSHGTLAVLDFWSSVLAIGVWGGDETMLPLWTQSLSTTSVLLASLCRCIIADLAEPGTCNCSISWHC